MQPFADAADGIGQDEVAALLRCAMRAQGVRTARDAGVHALNTPTPQLDAHALATTASWPPRCPPNHNHVRWPRTSLSRAPAGACSGSPHAHPHDHASHDRRYSPDAESQWYYRDDDGNLQGPFAESLMGAWAQGAMLGPDLVVHCGSGLGAEEEQASIAAGDLRASVCMGCLFTVIEDSFASPLQGDVDGARAAAHALELLPR